MKSTLQRASHKTVKLLGGKEWVSASKAPSCSVIHSGDAVLSSLSLLLSACACPLHGGCVRVGGGMVGGCWGRGSSLSAPAGDRRILQGEQRVLVASRCSGGEVCQRSRSV